MTNERDRRIFETRARQLWIAAVTVGSTLGWAAIAHAQEKTQAIGKWSDVDWAPLAIAATFGAIGGVVYELIALQGNIEWPHRAVKEDLPQDGYGHAILGYLFDLGILARIVVGAAAAIIVFWVLPIADLTGDRLVAIALVAGSAGTAVFRSLQDRLIAALNAAKTESLTAGLKDLLEKVSVLESTPTPPADGAHPAVAAGAVGGQAALQTAAADIRGRIEALLKVASA